jgi:hypothetical protein
MYPIDRCIPWRSSSELSSQTAPAVASSPQNWAGWQTRECTLGTVTRPPGVQL